MKRRAFLKAVGGATGGLTLRAGQLFGAEGSEREVERVAGLPRRVLGRTGQKLSVVGFPGLALVHCDPEQCTKGLRSALERGTISTSRLWTGRVRADGHRARRGRSQPLLPACKTKKRDKAGAREEWKPRSNC